MNVAAPVSEIVDPEAVEALRDSIARVLSDECDSRSVHAYIDGKSKLDRVLWSQATDLGWLAAALPEAYGGLGLGASGLQVLHTELGRRAAPGPFIATLSVAQWLAEVGSDEQRERFLPAIAAGEVSVAAPAVVDGAPLQLKDDRVTGLIDMLGAPTAGLAVVPVGTGDKVEAWALLDPQGEGATLEQKETWDLTRQVCSLNCSGAVVLGLVADPDGSVGGKLRRHLSLALAADSIGAANHIAYQTVEYLKTRVQFERPIASFQAIKHRAANLVASIAIQEHLLAQAVESAATGAADADMWASLAKAGATESFAFVAGDCIQLHGGVGHTWEFDPHIYAKRARLNEALAADNRRMRDLAAEGLAEATRAGRSTTELAV